MMKKSVCMLLMFLMVLLCASAVIAEDAVTPADQAFSDEQVERAHVAAQEKLKADYLYDPELYTCILREATDEAFVFDFNWEYSATAIYSVTVPSTLGANNIDVSYNTDYSMDEYYSELNQVFCKDGGLFGDWSLEQKAWLCGIAEKHWELEKFRTYTINPEYQPYYSLFFQRLLERDKCGLPDEKSISEEEAYAIAIAYAEQDEAIAALKPWKVVQTFYLINEPQKPVWCFRIGKNKAHTYDIVIDAYTGSIEKITVREI